jgi:histidyl-tRNA synthetase
MSVLQTLDKLDKKSEDEVKQELSERSISSEEIKTLFELLKTVTEDQYLKDVIDIAKKIGTKNLEFSPYLMRGLDYYTGPIFETVVKEPKIGSVTGGGRYDKLVASLGGPDLPAVGTTIGLDRICDVIEELNLWPNLNSSGSLVLVTIFDPKLIEKSIALTKGLRDLSINTEIYLNSEADLKKQLKFANDKKVPFVAIIGSEEISKGMVKLKNMQTGEQKEFKNDDLPSIAAYVNTSLQKG